MGRETWNAADDVRSPLVVVWGRLFGIGAVSRREASAKRLDTFLQAVREGFQCHPHGLKLLLGLGMLQQNASTAAVAELHHYRDALMAWTQKSLSVVFELSDRPEVREELARFTLRTASGTAIARWFDPTAALETEPLRVALLALAAHHGVPLGTASAAHPRPGRIANQ